ncbi:hypothetical protein [Kitasatospora camelliae]|uniref:Uncharacterized protein n=1 Tax=Kitasatospora camelliae TaxID=3156397 RepID=A0AAU8K6F8_9ACTN
MKARYDVDAVVAMSLIRMAAADRALALWQRPSGERLARLGLDALLAGVDAPSLRLLAGLGRREYGEAPELFDRVLEELDLLPLLPEDLRTARWAAAGWWARRIVEREVDPLDGARLIWQEAAAELGYPAALQPMVELATAIDGSTHASGLAEGVIATAQHLLDTGTCPARAV